MGSYEIDNLKWGFATLLLGVITCYYSYKRDYHKVDWNSSADNYVQLWGLGIIAVVIGLVLIIKALFRVIGEILT